MPVRLPAILLLVAAAALAEPRARMERLPMHQDFDRCALRSLDRGEPAPDGRLRLQLFQRAGGQVYAAFVYADSGNFGRTLETCLSAQALLWTFPSTTLDLDRPYEVTFVGHSSDLDMSAESYAGGLNPNVPGRADIFLPDPRDVPKLTRLNPELAQRTLEVAEDAEPGERAIALLASGQSNAAQGILDPLGDTRDRLVQRARVLVKLTTDRPQARVAAEQLMLRSPESEIGHELLLRACLALHDALCAIQQYRKAAVAPDAEARAASLRELQPLVNQEAERQTQFDKVQPACVPEHGEDPLACPARRCLEAPVTSFANEVRALPGAWRSAKMRDGRLLLTVPLQGGEGPPELRWLVASTPRGFLATPMSSAARHVLELHPSPCFPLPPTRAGSVSSKAP